MTILDLLTRPELVTQAWDYFNNVQTKDVKYIPFITRDTPPPTHLNTEILAKYREQMRKFYYDPTKYHDLPRAARASSTRRSAPIRASRSRSRSAGGRQSRPAAVTRTGQAVGERVDDTE